MDTSTRRINACHYVNDHRTCNDASRTIMKQALEERPTATGSTSAESIARWNLNPNAISRMKLCCHPKAVFPPSRMLEELRSTAIDQLPSAMATSQNLANASVPMVLTAMMHIATINASMTAYSTDVGPSSSIRKLIIRENKVFIRCPLVMDLAKS